MATISQTRPTANESHSRTSSIASEAFDLPPISSNVVVNPIKSPNKKNNNFNSSSSSSSSISSNSSLRIITNINKLIMAQQDKRHQLVNHQTHQAACIAKSATGGITLAFPILPSSSSSNLAQPVATVVSSQSHSSLSLNSATTASASVSSNNRRRHFSPQPNASYATMTLSNTHPSGGGGIATAAGGTPSLTSSLTSIPGSAATTASASSSSTAASQQPFRPQQARRALLAAAAGLAHATPLASDILASANSNRGIMNMNSVASSGVVNIANANPLLINATLNMNSNINGSANASLNTIQTNPLLALNCANGNVVNAYTTAATAAALLPGGSVPEFLYQLTKMLTDNTNREIIEWSTYSGNGRIEVHHPGRLEKEILGRYFRHSKYSSFQRQLNYFGFRKIAGKGKMSPCSYVNENATMDIRSLLLMKRKNSKEKEKELLAQQLLKQQQQQQQQNNGLGGNESSTAAAVTAAAVTAAALLSGHNKRRPNPGDDIQPATIQPMFTTSIVNNANQITNNSANQMFTAALAANIARAIPASAAAAAAQVATNSIPINLQGNPNGSNKRPRLNQGNTITTPVKVSSSTAAPSDGRGYTVAIGKGVRHQLNGYLRATSNVGNIPTTNPIAPSTVSSATSSSTASIATANAPSSYQSYLSHPAANLASSAPAPLQFLDPSELGMSIESSLSQLKNAFAAASSVPPETLSSTIASAAAAAGTATATTDGPASSSAVPPSNDATAGRSAPQVKYAASALTRRVASNAFIGGMLSRDDSLINLAMLPTLDNADASTSTDTASGGDNQNDYMKSIFSREGSLMNLAAAGDGADDKTVQEKESATDTFDFIDFQT